MSQRRRYTSRKGLTLTSDDQIQEGTRRVEVAIGRVTGFHTPTHKKTRAGTQRTAVPIGRPVEGSGSQQKEKKSRVTRLRCTRSFVPPRTGARRERSRELNCCLVIEHRVDPAIAPLAISDM